MPKLHQIVAILATVKKNTAEAFTAAYHLLQKPALFSGMSKTYHPFDDEASKSEVRADRRSDEMQQVQQSVKEQFAVITKNLAELVDTTLTQDFGNTQARGTINVDGLKLENIPATSLLFLEKHLKDMRTVLSKTPVRDGSHVWTYSEEDDAYVTKPYTTFQTKKVMRNHVMAPATDKHPAQVQVYNEDVQVGEVLTRHLSTAISLKERNEMAERVDRLIAAVIAAREQANDIEVERREGLGKALADFIFKGDAAQRSFK